MWLRLILGILYFGMALGQAVSAAAMPDIIDSYDTVPEALLIPFIASLIAAETVGGLWLMLRPRSKALPPVWIYTAVSLVWTVLAVQAFARGLEVPNCGCFGVYLSQPLHWWVLAEDALMLVYAGLLLRSTHRAAWPQPTAGVERRSVLWPPIRSNSEARGKHWT